MAPKKKYPLKGCPPGSDPTDPNDRRYQRKRSIPANPQGVAYPERIAMLRAMFPDMAWIEGYQCGMRPNRYGGITEAEIAALRAQGPAHAYDAMILEYKREYCLARWRTWFDAKKGGGARRDVLTKREIERRKVARERNAAARAAKSALSAGEIAEREERRQAATRKRVAELKERKRRDPEYGLSAHQKKLKNRPKRKGWWRFDSNGRFAAKPRE